MELKFYIESGIIESFVLGLATDEEVAELQHLRRLYPELDTEVEHVERRLERAAFDEAVMPPVEIRSRVLQKIRWDQQGRAYADPGSNYTFINIQPKDGDHITVHKWWKIFFIIFFIMSKVFLFLAIFYYLKYRQSQEQHSDRFLYHTQASETTVHWS
ncbi:hypothetical protein [Chitinophaga sp. 212800010-3]|uniref:hypothetical protein n=1 Tax=unclassified Chitinophaga TaxID=2619133 RepID=UPI002DF54C0B|nr:SPOR domain-containing protein [Chitinophaga sp. 212800010-3]